MNNLQCRKAYVRVNLDVDEEGTIIPMLLCFIGMGFKPHRHAALFLSSPFPLLPRSGKDEQ